MNIRWRRVGGAVLSLWAAGCAAGQEPNPCHQDFEITVTVDANARITWSPACGMAEVAIAESPAPGEPGPVRWWIRTPDQRNTIESGVEYGEAPGGTVTVAAPDALEVGQSYHVSLLFYTPFGDGQSMLGSAGARFTR